MFISIKKSVYLAEHNQLYLKFSMLNSKFYTLYSIEQIFKNQQMKGEGILTINTSLNQSRLLFKS